ncbi:MAG: rhomboid family intramembrane serine protease [Acidimicrobiales bacterium]
MTSLFLHTGWAHLGVNMLFLWIFGNNIEDRIGHIPFAAFYLVSGIFATLGHVAADPSSTIAVLGASGAIAGLMGAYLAWFPDAPIRTLVFLIVVDIRARWFLLGWFALQFFTAADSAVAWVSHVVGFGFGFVLALAVRGLFKDPTGGAGRGPYPHPSDWIPSHGA